MESGREYISLGLPMKSPAFVQTEHLETQLINSSQFTYQEQEEDSIKTSALIASAFSVSLFGDAIGCCHCRPYKVIPSNCSGIYFWTQPVQPSKRSNISRLHVSFIGPSDL